MAEIAVHVVITGRVQGVWFRGWTKQEARALNITGWIRNRFDGTVEAVFAGNAADVDAMVGLCWHGPPAAQVADVRKTITDDPGQVGFRHLPTL